MSKGNKNKKFTPQTPKAVEVAPIREPLALPNRELIALPGIFPAWVDPDSVVGVKFLATDDGLNYYASVHTDEGFAISCVAETGQNQEVFIQAVLEALGAWTK